MVIWMTGNTGAGKTTLAQSMVRKNTLVLDGDEIRTLWPSLGMSETDRRENCLRIAKLAKLLESQGLTVIVAVICPYADLRREVDTICNPVWIYVPGGKVGEEYPYEIPYNPTMTVKK